MGNVSDDRITNAKYPIFADESGDLIDIKKVTPL